MDLIEHTEPLMVAHYHRTAVELHDCSRAHAWRVEQFTLAVASLEPFGSLGCEQTERDPAAVATAPGR